MAEYDPKTQSTERERKQNMNGNLTKAYDLLFKDKAAVWTALFTCILAIFTYLLYQVSKTANDTSTATQAALVSSFGPSLSKVLSDDGKTLKGYNAVFTWVNNGTTPSKSTLMQSNVTVGRDLPTRSLDFSSLPQSKIMSGVIGPKAGIQVQPSFISLKDFEDVAQERTHMFMWGWATYKDVFSNTPRLSEYCFDVQGANWTKPNHADPTTDMTIINPPCGVHFCFNEECEDYSTRTK
jgi:hypothetical protein